MQEEAETLVELQDRLQDARDTTEALQVQVGGGCKRWGPTRGPRPGLVSAYFLSDGGGDTKGRGRAADAGPAGALWQLQQEMDQGCRPELQQVHGQLAGKGNWEWGAQTAAVAYLPSHLSPLQSFRHAWPACARAVEISEAWSAPSPRAGRAP